MSLMLDILQHSGATERTPAQMPTIEDLLKLTPEAAAKALQGIPDRSIYKLGMSVGREAQSYDIFGGISAICAGLGGDLRAVTSATNDNASRANQLKALEELFLAEYDRRSAMRRQVLDR